MTLFIDMDGVLADFDRHHETHTGVRPSKKADAGRGVSTVNWDQLRKVPNFYATIPPMHDMEDLWEFVLPYSPVILTGVPSGDMEAEAILNKGQWLAKYLGPDVPAIFCPSSQKSHHAVKGDVIVDDWDKYRLLWVRKGGHWVLHVSAEESIGELKTLLWKTP